MELDDDDIERSVKAALEGVPLLTIDIVKAKAVNGLVIVTCANWQYYDFVLNWVGHMQRLGVTNFLIGVLSKKRIPHPSQCQGLMHTVILCQKMLQWRVPGSFHLSVS